MYGGKKSDVSSQPHSRIQGYEYSGLPCCDNLFQIGIPNGEQPNQLVKKNLMVEILY